jgi:Skp family chaperone for outer membrane proteins
MNKSYFTGFLTGTTVVALGLVVLMVGSGFQGPSLKFGVVDSFATQAGMEQMQTLKEEEKNAFSARSVYFAFVVSTGSLRVEDAKKFRELSMKTTKTDADKIEMDRLKTLANDGKKKFEDLVIKQNPTDADLKLLDELRNRQAQLKEYLQVTQKELEQEMEALNNANLRKLSEIYKAAVTEVGKKQQFTLIFDKGNAPYAANDITDDVIKATKGK